MQSPSIFIEKRIDEDNYFGDYDLFLKINSKEKYMINHAIGKIENELIPFIQICEDQIRITHYNFKKFFSELIHLMITLEKNKYIIEYDSSANDFKKRVEEYKSEKEEQKSWKILNSTNSQELDIKINNSGWNENFIPKRFQIDHVVKNLNNLKGFCNFSTPGAGKTIMSYMLFSHLYHEASVNNILIIGPTSANEAWTEEYKIILKNDKRIKTINSVTEYNLKSLKNIVELGSNNEETINIVFINIHKLDDTDLLKKILSDFPRDRTMFVLDECHYVKNTDGCRFKSVFKLAEKFKYKLFLSGTPFPKKEQQTEYIFKLLFTHLDDKEINWSFDDESKKISTKQEFKNFYSRISEDKMRELGLIGKLNEEIINTNENLLEQKFSYLLSSLGFWDMTDDFEEFFFNEASRALIIRAMQASAYPPMLLPLMRDLAEQYEKHFNINEEKEQLLSVDKALYINDNGIKGGEDDIVIGPEESKKLDGKRTDIIIEKVIDLLKDKEIYKYVCDIQSKKVILNKWDKARELIDNYSSERLLVWDHFNLSINNFTEWIKNNIKDENRQIFKINGEINKLDRESILKNFKKTKNGILIATTGTLSESISLHKHVNRAIYLNKNFVAAHFEQSKYRIHRLCSSQSEVQDKYLYHINAKSYNGNKTIDEMIDSNLKLKMNIQSTILN